MHYLFIFFIFIKKLGKRKKNRYIIKKHCVFFTYYLFAKPFTRREIQEPQEHLDSKGAPERCLALHDDNHAIVKDPGV